MVTASTAHTAAQHAVDEDPAEDRARLRRTRRRAANLPGLHPGLRFLKCPAAEISSGASMLERGGRVVGTQPLGLVEVALGFRHPGSRYRFHRTAAGGDEIGRHPDPGGRIPESLVQPAGQIVGGTLAVTGGGQRPVQRPIGGYRVVVRPERVGFGCRIGIFEYGPRGGNSARQFLATVFGESGSGVQVTTQFVQGRGYPRPRLPDMSRRAVHCVE